jgi:hypothetical protein
MIQNMHGSKAHVHSNISSTRASSVGGGPSAFRLQLGSPLSPGPARSRMSVTKEVLTSLSVKMHFVIAITSLGIRYG